jgi:hypothetical protein
VPNPFQLSLNRLGTTRGAQIVWKKGRDVGILFDKTSAEETRSAEPRSWVSEARRTLNYTTRA